MSVLKYIILFFGIFFILVISAIIALLSRKVINKNRETQLEKEYKFFLNKSYWDIEEKIQRVNILSKYNSSYLILFNKLDDHFNDLKKNRENILKLIENRRNIDMYINKKDIEQILSLKYQYLAKKKKIKKLLFKTFSNTEDFNNGYITYKKYYGIYNDFYKENANHIEDKYRNISILKSDIDELDQQLGNFEKLSKEEQFNKLNKYGKKIQSFAKLVKYTKGFNEIINDEIPKFIIKIQDEIISCNKNKISIEHLNLNKFLISVHNIQNKIISFMSKGNIDECLLSLKEYYYLKKDVERSIELEKKAKFIIIAIKDKIEYLRNEIINDKDNIMDKISTIITIDDIEIQNKSNIFSSDLFKIEQEINILCKEKYIIWSEKLQNMKLILDKYKSMVFLLNNFHSEIIDFSRQSKNRLTNDINFEIIQEKYLNIIKIATRENIDLFFIKDEIYEIEKSFKLFFNDKEEYIDKINRYFKMIKHKVSEKFILNFWIEIIINKNAIERFKNEKINILITDIENLKMNNEFNKAIEKISNNVILIKAKEQ